MANKAKGRGHTTVEFVIAQYMHI
ncbi:uncharacterized protein G2W53_020412 [Senna tora]|uniref:Uncharacterized protein n=1 Tax=Senna tora TaxID=362788 RepID=A0A834WQ32_9FABA|nr:uncharacterized protein G2W53_020412 [Senna tora]